MDLQQETPEAPPLAARAVQLSLETALHIVDLTLALLVALITISIRGTAVTILATVMTMNRSLLLNITAYGTCWASLLVAHLSNASVHLQ